MHAMIGFVGSVSVRSRDYEPASLAGDSMCRERDLGIALLLTSIRCSPHYQTAGTDHLDVVTAQSVFVWFYPRSVIG